MPLGKRAFAELIGTFWLVFGGCGSAGRSTRSNHPVYGSNVLFYRPDRADVRGAVLESSGQQKGPLGASLVAR